MMWMGLASAWGALAMGVMFAVNAYFRFATGAGGWIYAGVAVLLLAGGFRTLRKMSGGLRLLSGAWGCAAGLLMLPLTTGRSLAALSAGEIAFALIALAGLALTVLHQERK